MFGTRILFCFPLGGYDDDESDGIKDTDSESQNIHNKDVVKG